MIAVHKKRNKFAQRHPTLVRGLRRISAIQRLFVDVLTGFYLRKLQQQLTHTQKEINVLKEDLEEIKSIIRPGFNQNQNSFIERNKQNPIATDSKSKDYSN